VVLTETTIRRTLARVDAEVLAAVIGAWLSDRDHPGQRRRALAAWQKQTLALTTRSRLVLAPGDASQTTRVRTRIAMTTLWALCTAIPIQALRYRLVGYARMNVSSSVAGIAHGMWRW